MRKLPLPINHTIPLSKAFLWTVLCILFFGHSIQSQSNNILTCKGAQSMDMEWGCQLYISPGTVLMDTSGLDPYPLIEIWDQNGNKVPNPIPKAYINQTLDIQVYQKGGGNQSCWTSIKPQDTQGPVIIVKDTILYCNSSTLPNPDLVMQAPIIQDYCHGVTQISHKDYISMHQCAGIGFKSSFEYSNWEFTNDCGGFLMDTTNDQIFKFCGPASKINPCTTSMAIQVPVPGTLEFRWKVFGDGNPNTENLWFIKNGIWYQLSAPDTLMHTYQAGTLDAGDIIQFSFRSNGDSSYLCAYLMDFTFRTQTVHYIKRQWKAIDGIGNISTAWQTLAVNNPKSSQIKFPAKKILQNITTSCAPSAHPNQTGWPTIEISNGGTNQTIPITPYASQCLDVQWKDDTSWICKGSYNIHRIWSLQDDCMIITTTGIQEIEVRDLIPPAITCKDTLTYFTGKANCSSIIQIPPPTIYEACSPPGTFQLESPWGKGLGPFTSQATGVYSIQWTAKDACENLGEKISYVWIKDTTKPALTLPNSFTVFLDNSGQQVINASSLGITGSDNCCMKDIFLKQSTSSTFSSELALHCPTGNTNKRQLQVRAVDCSGNAFNATISVTIKDTIKPSITCPASKTVTCFELKNNLNVYGTPMFQDNCDAKVYVQDQFNLSLCKSGSILRTWKAQDLANNSATCVQVITVQAETWNASNTAIQWPQDHTFDACSAPTGWAPSQLQAPFSAPTFSQDTGCAEIQIIWKDDEIINPSPGICKKLVRTWRVINACNNQEWSHIQTLLLEDNIPPIIQVPQDVTAALPYGSCQGANVGGLNVSVTDCSSWSITNSFNGTGLNVNGYYPPGKTKVLFQAQDACGNQSIASFNVHLLDNKGPEMTCKNGLNLSLQGAKGNGSASILPQDCIASISDNCSIPSKIFLQINQSQFNCTHVGKFNSVICTATDETGNVSSCSLNITVSDPQKLCDTTPPPPPPPTYYTIAGKVTTYDNKPISNVILKTANPSLIPSLTNMNGDYTLNQASANTTYSVSAAKNTSILNGVNTYDLLILHGNLSGQLSWNGSWQILAADINKSNSISIADEVNLKKVILGVQPTFTNNESWRFYAANHVFADPLQPFIDPIPEMRSASTNQSNIQGIDFIGTKVGDLNNNSDPKKIIQTDDRDDKEVGFLYEIKPVLNETNQYEIGVSLNNAHTLLGGQWGFKTSNADWKIVSYDDSESVCTSDDIGWSTDTGGVMRFVWIKQPNMLESKMPVIKLKLEYQGSGIPKEPSIELTGEEEFESFAVDTTWRMLLFQNSITYTTPVPEKKSFISLYPNPTNSSSQLNIDLNEQEVIQIQVLNSEGCLIFHKNISCPIGHSKYALPTEDWPPGLYYCRIYNSEGAYSFPLLKLETL